MVTERTFDYRTEHDERSRSYAIRDTITPVPVTSRFWTAGPLLDQGREGACVGNGIAGDLGASPVRVRNVTEDLAMSIYRDARAIDGFPDDEGDGTSVLAGMKIAVQRGYYTGYRWAFSMADVEQSLLQVGPVVIGINWYSGLYEAPTGIAEVSGEMVGGHCILLTGVTVKRKKLGKLFRWRNSWGPSYGINGSAYIREADLYRLLVTERGEAAIPVGRQIPSL